MNHYVPDFDMEDEYSIPASSTRTRKSTMPEDEIMELVWQDGRLVINSQTQKPGNKRSRYDAVIPQHTTIPAAAPPPQQQHPENQPQLFMQEDEMATWLQYPLADDDSFCADLLYNNNSSNVQPNNQPPVSTPPPRPPVHPPLPPPRRTELQNFLHFGRLNSNSNNNNRSRYDSSVAAPPRTRSVVTETTTVVGSNDTPRMGPGSMIMDSGLDASNNSASISISRGGRGLVATATATTSVGAAAPAASTGKDAVTCEMSLTSPGGGSTSMSGSLSPDMPPPPAENRKRKGGEPEDAECQNEDVQFEPAGAKSGKKQCQGSTSTKRSRAVEVHNLSERRRRDRISEKMRCLQELMPRCNKSDKASMLDEAIEYLKSLQLQVQMMSMGCSMVPMMFPGVQPYTQMGMGMGMGVEMGMTRPIMPYGNVLAGSTMPTAPAAAHMKPSFPMPVMPPYPMQTMLPNDPNRIQATNHSEHMSNLLVTQSQNQSRGPNVADPYQQYFTPHQIQMQMQMQLQQNQLMAQPSSSKPSSSMGTEVQESPQ